MTVRIAIPLGFLRMLLLVTVAWGGAAGVAFAVTYRVDNEAVSQDDLRNYVTTDQLSNYATYSQLSSLRSELSPSRSTKVSPHLESVLGFLVLDAVARGRMRADVVKDEFFKTASSSEFDACISWLSGAGAGQVAGREACGRVRTSADFGD